eukprot:scaffold21331_cov117-Isochrysis_galbana.AAC.6
MGYMLTYGWSGWNGSVKEPSSPGWARITRMLSASRVGRMPRRWGRGSLMCMVRLLMTKHSPGAMSRYE